MADDMSDLNKMADLAGESARPLPPEQVRSLGDRRHGRRTLATAGIALVTLLVVGGAVFAGLVVFRGTGQTATPPVAVTPSGGGNPSGGSGSSSAPSTPPKPARVLTANNLLTTEDVPLEDYDTQQVVVVKPGVGRPVPESSVCLPANGLQDLGATQVLSRNFRYELIDGSKPDKDDPFRNQPIIYSQALQFADAAAAKAARARYASWLKTCPKNLEAKGYQLLPDLGFDSTKVDTERGTATVTEWAYRRPGGVDGESGVWESVGLTLVGDRMMVTVFLHWGMDWEVTINSSEGDLLHPQVGLVDSASIRLNA